MGIQKCEIRFLKCNFAARRINFGQVLNYSYTHFISLTTMKKIIVYAATSLDGMIAKADGSVDWLEELPNPDQLDYGYFDFYDGIDTTIMGNKTYQQVLGFDVPFPYNGKANYVLTRNEALTKDENVEFISKDPIETLHNLKESEGKDIWLIGGGAINTLLLNNGLIDQVIVHVMPVILGDGIPLFNKEAKVSTLKLIESKSYPTGVIEMRYDLEM